MAVVSKAFGRWRQRNLIELLWSRAFATLPRTSTPQHFFASTTIIANRKTSSSFGLLYPSRRAQNENVISSKTITLTHLIIHPPNLNDTHLNSYCVPSDPLQKSDLSLPQITFGLWTIPLIRCSVRE